MPWVSGSFSRFYGATGWQSDLASNIYILASRHDTHDQDLSDGINACITRDNQAKPTASFLPQTNNAIDLGSSSFIWRAIYGYLDSGYVKYAQTAAELAASVTPVNLYIPHHNITGTCIVDRYGTNTTPGTTSMQTALDNAKLVSQQSGCPIELLASTYLGTLSLRFNNAGVIGQGSHNTILKNPAGALSPGGVIEVGDTASGNSATAYDRFVCYGLTVDGNKANATAPTDDLKGHGVILTKITNWVIYDVKAKNCHNAGVIPVIDSNYGYVDCVVESCGNATHTAPGFDINSSKFITGRVISKSCYQGARNLDNTRGNILNITIDSPTIAGFTDGNQTVNESYDNQFTIAVYNGASDGVQIGNNARNSIYNITVDGCSANGVQEVYYATASQRPSGNIYNVSTKGCGQSSCIIGGDGGTWNITSYQDGRTGAAGTSYAVQVTGQRNNYTVNVTDSATPQIRGITLSATSATNHLIKLTRNTLVSDYSDSGTGNTFAPVIYRGSKTYDAPNLAAGAQTSTTITVTGAKTGSTRTGDIAQTQYNANIGGITIYSEVTANDTVTAWLTNETAGAIDLGSLTISSIVISGVP